MRTLPHLSLVAVVLLAACGGPGNFEGSVGGNSLSVKESIFFIQPFQTALGQGAAVTLGNAVTVFMSDQTGLCDKLKSNTVVHAAAAQVLVLAVANGGLSITDNLTTGSYRLFTAL